MHYEGSHKFGVHQNLLWLLLNDPIVLARITPGVKELIPIADGVFEAVFHIKMGPINSTFKGKMEVREKVAPRRYKLIVNVDAKIGMVAAEALIGLRREGQGTVISFSGNGRLSGKLARMGQRVLIGVARMMAKRFFKGLEEEIPEGGIHKGGEIMELPIKVTVNGLVRENRVEPRLTLVKYLRETLGLTGTHVGCDTSGCGACTVLVDGEAIKSCNLLAVQADGREITTIEGLATDSLHPLQDSFHQAHGLQCGFCTPGMILASVALLKRNPDPTDAEIRQGLEGNFCRCTGYHNIVKAVQNAARKME